MPLALYVIFISLDTHTAYNIIVSWDGFSEKFAPGKYSTLPTDDLAHPVNVYPSLAVLEVYYHRSLSDR